MSLATILRAGAVLAVAAPRVMLGQTRGELPARLQPTTRVAIEQLADSMSRESLPTALLYDKAAEGVLKGAEDARILSAVRGLAQRLRDARTLLGPNAPDAELAVGASALHAGASAPSISRLVEARNERLPGRSLGVPLIVLANLVADGVPAQVATESLTTLMGRGARDDELSAFRWSVARDIQGGKQPGDAAVAGTVRLLQAIDTRPRQP